MQRPLVGALVFVAAVGVSGAAAAAIDPADAHPDLHLIPWPKTLRVGEGHMPLTADSRIVAGEERLRPLADVLSGEIALLTGLKLKAATGQGRAGDIVLRIDKEIRADEQILVLRARAETNDRRRTPSPWISRRSSRGLTTGRRRRAARQSCSCSAGRTAVFGCPS